jgi:hypothetical protein
MKKKPMGLVEKINGKQSRREREFKSLSDHSFHGRPFTSTASSSREEGRKVLLLLLLGASFVAWVNLDNRRTMSIQFIATAAYAEL